MNLVQNIISFSDSFLGGFTPRKFRSHFGVTPEVVATIYLLCSEKAKIKLRNILWTLYFLKIYPLQDEACARWEVHHSTWVLNLWETIGLLNEIFDLVCFIFNLKRLFANI